MYYYNIPNSQKMYFKGISSIARQKSYMLESVIIPGVYSIFQQVELVGQQAAI